MEYDIYIGQSITTEKPFREIYLKNLRLIQLRSMATIDRNSHALLADLPIRVETTQLIFIHSQPIDIKFRKDEKRFEVEGSYNIRYQIIKKRIDKVRIRIQKKDLLNQIKSRWFMLTSRKHTNMWAIYNICRNNIYWPTILKNLNLKTCSELLD